MDIIARRFCIGSSCPLAVALAALLVGCRTAGREPIATDAPPSVTITPAVYEKSETSKPDSLLESRSRLPSGTSTGPLESEFEEGPFRQKGPTHVVAASATSATDYAALAELIAEATAVNPQIRRLEAEAAAAWERVPQVRALPDPMLQTTGFGVPQFMADGQMWATLMLSQSLPYFKELDARGQQAAFEAMMLQQEVRSAKLQIAADVEEMWHRIYHLEQLLRINEANRQLVASLVEVATGRVEVAAATPGDVVLGTLELSRLEEERVTLRQQSASRKAMLNRLLDRPADTPIAPPATIAHAPVELSLEGLRSVAFQRQPQIVAARLRTEATAWGVRVARLESVPEVTLSYEHMFMDINPGVVGSDPWRAGLGMNLPLWRGKYRAMEREALQQNLAARRGVDETMREYDAMLLDLLEQARAAQRTAQLYRNTILPQSRQALEVDQRAYGQGTVTFERVIADARNLLTAEAALHRTLSDRAIALARLKQAAGGELPASAEEISVPPPLTPLMPD